MDRKDPVQITVSVFGVYMGLGGIEHGIGEILQGRQPPPALIFPSWPEARFFHIVAGEPAMSLIPDLFLGGLLTVFFSLCFIVWSIVCSRFRYGGPILMLLAAAMLLCGGGIFPPIIGIFMGLLATFRNTAGRKHLQPTASRSTSWLWYLWMVCFSVCLAAFLLLFPGLSVLDVFFGLDDPGIPAVLLPAAMGSLALSIVLAFLQRQISIRANPAALPFETTTEDNIL